MDNAKRDRLKKAGWSLGSAQDLLGLSDEETALIRMKLALATNLKKRRNDLGLTQIEAAAQLKSSQSRVAKMESADVSVSIDLLVRSLLALGASRSDIGRVIGRKRSVSAA